MYAYGSDAIDARTRWEAVRFCRARTGVGRSSTQENSCAGSALDERGPRAGFSANTRRVSCNQMAQAPACR